MRTVFLDRDGTLNREQGYVTAAEQMVLLPVALPAVTLLHDAGFRLVVVTNQSGIARGLYSEQDLSRVHERIQDELGGRIAGFFHCPHHPDVVGPYGGACACRKPGAGLLQQACEVLQITCEQGFLVGDCARDVLMARGTPLRTVYVHSGKAPEAELAALAAAAMRPDLEAPDVLAAARWILQQP